MAVPKRRQSRSATKQRRAHQALAKPNYSPCSNCGELTPSHQVCPKCGHYAGREVLPAKD